MPMKATYKRMLLNAIGLAVVAFIVCRKWEAFAQIATVLAFASVFTLSLLPMCAHLERRGMHASGAALCCVLSLLAAMLLLVSSFIPYLVVRTIDLIRRITPTLAGLLQNGGQMLEQFGFIAVRPNALPDMLATMMSAVTAKLARAGVAFAAQTGQLVFALVIAYYLLRERAMLANHLMLLIPTRWRMDFLTGMRGCKNALMCYLSGVFKTSLFVGVATFAGLALLGVRDAPLLSLYMGILEMLPYIGPVLASAPILLSALPQGTAQAFWALLLVVLVQQAEGNFVSPYFTASSTSIHPLAALLSVFVFGCLLGIWGILLAIPLVVTARSVFWSVRQAELWNET